MEIQPDENTYKNYLFFWVGQIFSIFGSSVVFFVLIWWITVTTVDPIAISIATFSYLIPVIIISPIAGIVTDRYDRKKVILIVDSLQAFSTFILILFFMFNLIQFWILLIFIVFRSIFQAFHTPITTAIIPSMVPKDKLSRINGINTLFSTFINVIGPLAGGVLFFLFDVAQALWIDVITFFISLVPLLLIKIPRVGKLREKREKSYLALFKEGLSVTKSISGLLTMMFAFMILNGLNQPRSTLMVYFIKSDHGGSVLDYSLVSMTLNIGLFAGGVLATVKKKWKHKMRVIYIAYLISLIGNILFATTILGNIPQLMIYAAVGAVSVPVINSLYVTIIHLRIPQDKVGRVVSIDTTLSYIAMPVGTLLAGPLALAIGTPLLFFISAILSLIIITLIYFFSNVRTLG